jgi:hypothetical protein
LVRVHGAEPQTQPERIFPILLSEKDINSHPQDLEALLVLGIELAQFSQGVLEHAEFGVSLRDANYLLEGHRP